MTKQEIVAYVMNTPHNTNRVILEQMLDQLIGQQLNTNDATATAADIKKGKTAYIKGKKVTGTFDGVSTTDANATAGDIRQGKTAYVKGQKVTGSLVVAAE